MSKMGDSSSGNQFQGSETAAATTGVKRRTTTMPKQITNKGESYIYVYFPYLAAIPTNLTPSPYHQQIHHFHHDIHNLSFHLILP